MATWPRPVNAFSCNLTHFRFKAVKSGNLPSKSFLEMFHVSESGIVSFDATWLLFDPDHDVDPVDENWTAPWESVRVHREIVVVPPTADPIETWVYEKPYQLASGEEVNIFEHIPIRKFPRDHDED